jgi:carbamoyl-phosphate synthase large subunit
MIEKIKICITCVGGRLIYDIIKALRDANDYEIKIIGIDSDKNASGRLLCDDFYVVPHSESNPDGWLKSIHDISKDENINGLITFSEGESRLVGKNKNFFKKLNIKVTVTSNNIVKILTDKFLMLTYLAKNGLDVGSFYDVNAVSDFMDIAVKLGYPNKKVVFKPRFGRGSRGVLIADSKQKVFNQLLPGRFCGSGTIKAIQNICKERKIFISDYIAMPYYGGDVWDVDVLSKNGKVVNVAARVRQLKNPLWPTSTGHKASADQRIIIYASKISNIFKIHGPSDYDIVIDDEGKPKVLDAAARFSGSVGVSYIAGVNMMSQLLRVMFNIPLKEFKFKSGMVLRPYITMAPILDKNENDFL